VDSFLRDVRYAIRQIVAQRSTAAVAILTLAIGIGANVSVFSLINAMLFRPAAARDPGSLVWITPKAEHAARYSKWSTPNYQAFVSAARSYVGAAAFAERAVSVGGESAQRVSAQFVSGNFFDVVGVRPHLGRTFLPEEDAVGTAGDAVVLGHDLWVTRFAADSSLIGRRIIVNARAVTVVGVMPQSFAGLSLTDPAQMWVTLASLPVLIKNEADVYTGGGWLRVVGRLRSDATLESAAAEAAALAGRFADRSNAPSDVPAEVRARFGRMTLAVEPLSGGLAPSNRAKAVPALSLIVLVPLLVIVVASANVANLLIARTLQRRKEFAVRRALGASRGRLVRQMLTETTILAILAGIAGVIVASWMTTGISMLGGVPSQFAAALTPDAHVFAATFVLTLCVGAFFGIVPAFAATRDSLSPALRNQAITLRIGRSRHRLRNVFVVSQVSVSLLLLITAGLFVRSLAKALNVPLGFDAHNVVTMSYDTRAQGYDDDRSDAFDRRLLDALRGAPGITEAALTTALPMGSGGARVPVTRGDVPAPRHGGEPPSGAVVAGRGAVTSRYFEALRIPTIRGRTFAETDTRKSSKVAVIDQALAQQLWPNEDPIGKQIRPGFKDGSTAEVVGIVAVSKYESLTETESSGYVFIPASQDDTGSPLSLVVRSPLGVGAATDAALKTAKTLDATLPVFDVNTMEHTIEASVTAQRAAAALLGVLGTLALGLAALGLYGVLAQSVGARTREIGIRMSLGARSADVVRWFVRDGLVLTLVGAAIGIVMSVAVSRVLGSLLFGLSATDGMTFAYACVVLSIVAFVASLIPARRAARIGPIEALRAE
jgi:predicted permease